MARLLNIELLNRYRTQVYSIKSFASFLSSSSAHTKNDLVYYISQKNYLLAKYEVKRNDSQLHDSVASIAKVYNDRMEGFLFNERLEILSFYTRLHNIGKVDLPELSNPAALSAREELGTINTLNLFELNNVYFNIGFLGPLLIHINRLTLDTINAIFKADELDVYSDYILKSVLLSILSVLSSNQDKLSAGEFRLMVNNAAKLLEIIYLLIDQRAWMSYNRLNKRVGKAMAQIGSPAELRDMLNKINNKLRSLKK